MAQLVQNSLLNISAAGRCTLNVATGDGVHLR
jgi:hypothetical protein